MSLRRTALIVLLLHLLTGGTSLRAQSANRDLEQAIERFRSGEMEEAIADTRKLLGGKDDTHVWGLLIDMYQYRLQDARDPSARIARDLFSRNVHLVRDANQCLLDLLNACREATYATICPSASQHLRTYLVDVDPDTALNGSAASALSRAEEAFFNKRYDQAIEEYRRVLNEHPGHYKATLYIGDCHYFKRELDSAIVHFRAAKAMQPTLLEPRKYLVDALGAAARNEEGLAEALPCFAIYPDESMFMKTSDLCERLHRRMERGWMKRGATVNVVGEDQDEGDGPWKRYRQAKVELEPYCDAHGVVVKAGAPDGARYLEVYAWERMLAGDDLPPEMDFARRMQAAGWLDCYVFICLFHQDLFDQYRDFADAEGDRIIAFITDQLMH